MPSEGSDGLITNQGKSWPAQLQRLADILKFGMQQA